MESVKSVFFIKVNEVKKRETLLYSIMAVSRVP
jgi:hypothetical protein